MFWIVIGMFFWFMASAQEAAVKNEIEHLTKL